METQDELGHCIVMRPEAAADAAGVPRVVTALVILHHTAITYGGSGGWFYREVSETSTASSLMLTAFCAVNQSFFMGMFFLLAGYFTPASLARKGARAFVRDRLVRLGLPMLVFGFVLGPLTGTLARVPDGRDLVDSWLGLLAEGAFVVGSLWFAWALLIFSLASAGWRLVRPEDGTQHVAAHCRPTRRAGWHSTAAGSYPNPR